MADRNTRKPAGTYQKVFASAHAHARSGP